MRNVNVSINDKIIINRFNRSKTSFYANHNNKGEVKGIYKGILILETNSWHQYIYLGDKEFDDFKILKKNHLTMYKDLDYRYNNILMFSHMLKDIQYILIKNVIHIYCKITVNEGNKELIKVIDTYLFKSLEELDKYSNMHINLLKTKLKVVSSYKDSLKNNSLKRHVCQECGEYYMEDDNDYFNKYGCCDMECYAKLVGVSLYSY